MSKKKNNYSFSFIEIIAFLIKWRKQLIIVIVASAILSAIFSGPYFIQPQYKSVAIFYPGTTNSIASNLFYSIKDKAKDPLKFGDEEVDEQYLQLLESSELKQKVMDRFKLMEHYKIDSARKDKFTALYVRYDKNVKIRRTSYNSIEITVFDEDPKMAADIANGILYFIDEVKKDIQGRMAKQIFTIVEEQFKNKIAYVDTLKSHLQMLGMNGVYLGIKGVYGAPQVRKPDESSSSKSNINGNGAEYFALEEELNYEVEQLSILRLKYDQAKVDIEAKLSNIFVVSYAGVSEGKAYPIRWIIVIVSVLSAFVMACLLILFIEKYQEFKRNIIV